MRERAHRQMHAIKSAMAGIEIAARAHQRVDVEVVADRPARASPVVSGRKVSNLRRTLRMRRRIASSEPTPRPPRRHRRSRRGNGPADRRRCDNSIRDTAGRCRAGLCPPPRAAGRDRISACSPDAPCAWRSRASSRSSAALRASSSSVSSEGRSTLTISAIARIFSKRLRMNGSRLAVSSRSRRARSACGCRVPPPAPRGLRLVVLARRGNGNRGSSNRPIADTAASADSRGGRPPATAPPAMTAFHSAPLGGAPPRRAAP